MFLFAVALQLSDLNLKQGTVQIARLKGSLDSTQNLLKPLLTRRRYSERGLGNGGLMRTLSFSIRGSQLN
jgi:hypothetical protein